MHDSGSRKDHAEISIGTDRDDALTQALGTVAKGVAAFTGEPFFRELAKSIASTFGIRFAFVAELVPGGTRVRTLAYWDGEKFLDNVEFELAGTPCRDVLNGKFTHHPKRVAKLFPEDKPLSAMGVEGYVGVPLLSADHDVLGHLALLDTKVLNVDPEFIATLRVIASRACMELERQRAEARLRESEDRLSTVVGSAMDAIIAIDEERKITVFNAAAENMFGSPAEASIGQAFDQFFSARFQAFFEGYVNDVQLEGTEKRPLWAPTGLSALRSNGEEFPVEATISPMVRDGKRLFTLILRDVNERKEAEQVIARLQMENAYLQEELFAQDQLGEIISGSGPMQEVLDSVEQVSPTDSTVLIFGETGTGKELVAQAIHRLSRRKKKLLINLNCAALPSELIESELFGHEKGAFTGAAQQRKGRFELADGGTLFLDEVGELSLEAQAKLLRVLQSQNFERVGGSKSISVDVRVIAATNRDLAEMVKEGAFRSDLYYRLNVFPIHVPPLRARRADIPALAEKFLGGCARTLGKPLLGISVESMERLTSYSWPGNVRELQNVIERAAILARSEMVDVDPNSGPGVLTAQQSTGQTLEEVERTHIISVLERTNGVIEGANGAATILDLHPNTLRSRMRKLGIKRTGAS